MDGLRAAPVSCRSLIEEKKISTASAVRVYSSVEFDWWNPNKHTKELQVEQHRHTDTDAYGIRYFHATIRFGTTRELALHSEHIYVHYQIPYTDFMLTCSWV